MSTPSPQAPLRLGQLLSVQVGRVQRHGTPGAEEALHRPWKSAFFKEPVHGAVQVGTLGLEGDQQADAKHHGGPDKAVLMYSADHFGEWRAQFGLEGLAGGGFGENLTVGGFAEPEVCIGDRLRVGGVLLEVSQPRQPCSNINRRWGRKGITEAVTANGRGGWYLRVIGPGTLESGDEVHLESRPNPGATVALAMEAFYGRCAEVALIESLIGCAALTESFRAGLRRRVAELGVRA